MCFRIGRIECNRPEGCSKCARMSRSGGKAINSADTGLDGNSKPKPYIGIQYAAIPEFQGIATAVGQQFSAALVGQTSPGQALDNAQRLSERDMKRAGYIK